MTAHDSPQPRPVCAECGSGMTLRQSRYGLFYGCQRYPACRGTHGAHPDGKPLGTPADARTKAARVKAHLAFDRLWESGGKTRREAYRWLRRKTGICHIGSMTYDQCQDVIAKVAAKGDTDANTG